MTVELQSKRVLMEKDSLVLVLVILVVSCQMVLQHLHLLLVHLKRPCEFSIAFLDCVLFLVKLFGARVFLGF